MIRRLFLKSLILVLTVTFFTASQGFAQKYTLRMQAAVPNSSMFYTTLQGFADRVEKLSNGEIKVELYASGAIVKPFEILDAVSEGIITGGQAWSHYWSGKHPAGLLFSSPTAGLGVGLDQNSVLSWAWDGEGNKLLNEYYQDVLKYDIKAWLAMPTGPEAFGWFPKKITSLDELTNMKFRSPPGIPSETFRAVGIPVVSMPASEIIPAAERGVLDAAEWATPADDILLGFADFWKYYYLQGYHQAISISDVYINKTWFDKLPPHLQDVIEISMKGMIADRVIANVIDNSTALKSLVKDKGVHLEKTPDDFCQAYMKAVRKILDKYYNKSPFFKKVHDSLTTWADLTVPYQVNVYKVGYEMGKAAIDSGVIKTYK